MKITLKQLALFQAIAKFENVTQAAEAQFLTQSATSMALSSLENQLGQPLFDRVGKKLLLNANGKHILPKVVEIIDRAKELEVALKASPTHLPGTLKIGASSTIGNYVLPKIICQFMAKYPAVKVKLQVGNTEQIIHELLKFNIDIGFIEDSCHEPHIKSSIWQHDKLILFASPNYWLANKKRINLHDIQQAEWILREQGSGTRSVFEKAMGNEIKNLSIILELGSTEAIKQAVKENIGMSCLSKSTLAAEIAAGELVEIPCKSLTVTRHFYRIIHAVKYETEIMKAFQKIAMS